MLRQSGASDYDVGGGRIDPRDRTDWSQVTALPDKTLGPIAERTAGESGQGRQRSQAPVHAGMAVVTTLLRRTVIATALLSIAILATTLTAAPANAAGSGSCKGAHCWIVVTGPSVPGTKGSGTGGGGGPAPQCYVMDGTFKIVVECWSDQYGAWDRDTDCYYKVSDPQPPATDPVWAGQTPAQGRIYDVSCLAAGGPVHIAPARQMYLPGLPPGVVAVGPTPAQVASEALADLTVGGPEIGTAPRTAGRGLVGLPVWLWTDQTELTWGPIPVSKTDGGITVNVEANAQYVVWDMGDGNTVTCHNPGTSFGGVGTASPTCGYRYLTPSRSEPGGVYTVTATTHWLVTWTANTGDGGTLTTDVPSTTTITIDELEVVTS
jgi:hypothetical protein